MYVNHLAPIMAHIKHLITFYQLLSPIVMLRLAGASFCPLDAAVHNPLLLKA